MLVKMATLARRQVIGDRTDTVQHVWRQVIGHCHSVNSKGLHEFRGVQLEGSRSLCRVFMQRRPDPPKDCTCCIAPRSERQECSPRSQRAGQCRSPAQAPSDTSWNARYAVAGHDAVYPLMVSRSSRGGTIHQGCRENTATAVRYRGRRYHFKRDQLSEDTVTRSSQPPSISFAIGIIGLGILALVYGDFAEEWQTVVAWVPGRTALVYASGIVMLLGGIGLLLRRTTALAIRILFPFLLVGFLLQVPALAMAPLVEVNWESAAELAVLLCAGWVLFATRSGLGERSPLAFATGENGMDIARILFGLSLLPIGLSHFVYLEHTADLVPAWLPYRTGWVYLTGAAHIAAGLGVLFSVVPRLAAFMEAGMLCAFTLLVWLPRIVAAAPTRGTWTEFVVSWAITAGAWLVADSITAKDATP